MPSRRVVFLTGLVAVVLLAVAGLALVLTEPTVAQMSLGQAVGDAAKTGSAAGPRTTPFGLAGPAAQSGIGGYILAKQAEFYHALVKAVRAAKADGHALWLLAGLSFAYGLFHAAGPGHGKAVISSYLLADGGTLKRGALLAFAAGLVQALAAVLFVTVLAALIGATAVSMARTMDLMEMAAYGGIVAFGLYLTFAKGRAFLAVLTGKPLHAHDDACGCGDAHMPDPALLQEQGGWRRAAVAVVSAGARPCSGAILVLTFALSQGVFLSGVAAAFAMGLGTAVMVTAIAAIAVYGKRFAVRLAGTNSRWTGPVLSGVELLAALLVLFFGFALLTGYVASERLLPG